MKKRFSTDRQVAALSPMKGQKQTEYHHATEQGLVLRVGLTKKSWVVKYVLSGKRRKYTLPAGYPDMSLKEAAKECRRTRAQSSEGIDPLGKRIRKKKDATIEDVMTHYFKETAMAAKTMAESRRISEKDIIPELGNLKATDLIRQDVKNLHRHIVDRGAPVAANRTVELLRRAYNCAYEEEFININPFPALKKIKAKESARDRFLSESEIKLIWQAMEFESENMRDILRLLLLLGQRSMETMSMSVADIDWERKEWTVPAAMTKNGKPNVLPLPPLAWEIIKPRLNNERWIFPSAYNTTRDGAKGDGHTKSTKDAVRRLRKATGIDNWTGHDLRRTCRTIMARTGVLPHIAEQVLGHAQGGIEAVYDQHSYVDEKRRALEKVNREIGRLLGKEVRNKVVKLRGVG